MRIKTLLLTAALSVATIATAKADVFSVNVVGYVNVTLTNGFNLLGNPLVSSNNTLVQVLPSVPEGAQLYKFNTDGTFHVDLYSGGIWYDDATLEPSASTIAPGEGFFVFSPSVSNVTFVGEVKTGTNTVPIRNGFSLVSSVVPQTYELIGANFPAAEGMQHYRLAGSVYDTSLFSGGVWYNDQTLEPRQLFTAPAQGFWIFSGAATNWTRSFSVNN